eukprot:TRINITY_DN59731_c0_g1_i1.p3 TRINITY_DN59731_c0_g1~~TRINITY_DN59731_c0_g1_i1.p3  ORF type:complete len:135 (+),score=11.11 TRINITY_DN59731_c0_g1_i1:784-1188(+)
MKELLMYKCESETQHSASFSKMYTHSLLWLMLPFPILASIFTLAGCLGANCNNCCGEATRTPVMPYYPTGQTPAVVGQPVGQMVEAKVARTMEVLVPAGAVSGTMLQVTSPEGALLQVAVPVGAAPGSKFTVQY